MPQQILEVSRSPSPEEVLLQLLPHKQASARMLPERGRKSPCPASGLSQGGGVKPPQEVPPVLFWGHRLHSLHFCSSHSGATCLLQSRSLEADGHPLGGGSPQPVSSPSSPWCLLLGRSVQRVLHGLRLCYVNLERP